MTSTFKNLSSVLAQPIVKVLRELGAAAEGFGAQVYLIGGTVRDFLLKQDSADIDIMVEGSAIDMVESFKDSWDTLFATLPKPSKTAKFPRYGTAKLEFAKEFLPGKQVLDFSSARSETYESPGARPEVKPGDLRDDLYRRDFSINAMAISLNAKDFGTLYDLFDGEADLKNKLIRVLHDKSFIDDPIRLLRALRFMVRFGFSLEENTARLFQEAVAANYMQHVTKDRRNAELKKARTEAQVSRVLDEAKSRGLLAQLEA